MNKVRLVYVYVEDYEGRLQDFELNFTGKYKCKKVENESGKLVINIEKNEDFIDDFYRDENGKPLNLEISAIVGKNGTGKTTIIKLIKDTISKSSFYEVKIVLLIEIDGELFYLPHGRVKPKKFTGDRLGDAFAYPRLIYPEEVGYWAVASETLEPYGYFFTPHLINLTNYILLHNECSKNEHTKNSNVHLIERYFSKRMDLIFSLWNEKKNVLKDIFPFVNKPAAIRFGSSHIASQLIYPYSEMYNFQGIFDMIVLYGKEDTHDTLFISELYAALLDFICCYIDDHEICEAEDIAVILDEMWYDNKDSEHLDDINEFFHEKVWKRIVKKIEDGDINVPEESADHWTRLQNYVNTVALPHINDIFKKLPKKCKSFFLPVTEDMVDKKNKTTLPFTYSYFVNGFKWDKDISFIDSIHVEFDFGLSTGEFASVFLYSKLYDGIKKVKAEQGNNVDRLTLLIDEADMLIHPEWQGEYVKKLIDVLPKLFPETYFNIVIATHSPIMLSDIPKQNIAFLTRENGMIVEASRDKMPETFGANIFSLFKNAFFLDNVMGRYAEERIKLIITQIEAITAETDNEKITRIERDINNIGDEFIKNRLTLLLNSKSEKFREKMTKEQRIAELEAELARLKGDTNPRKNNRKI